jgi:hypothetical protein
MTWKTSRGLSEALRARGLSKGKPTELDRPPPKPLPGPKARPLPGQLSLADEITTTDEERRLP